MNYLSGKLYTSVYFIRLYYREIELIDFIHKEAVLMSTHNLGFRAKIRENNVDS